MTAHLPILPIVLPMLVAFTLLLPWFDRRPVRKRIATGLTLSVSLAVSLSLVGLSADAPLTYVLGGWQPPFGIVLLVDPLSSVMVALNSLLALICLLASFGGLDRGGRFFDTLFLMLVTGVNGAFLTGDIFNLFVFFEILLISSYALVLHGGGKAKTAAALHYVILNLVGSTLFLFALGTLYGSLGTLNMVDLASALERSEGDARTLAHAGVLLLVVVFGLKAAIVPLHFWLSRAYSSVVSPVAAVFAIMTKVGIYSFYRVHIQTFDGLLEVGEIPILAVFWTAALVTIALATLGVLAARRLAELSSWLVVLSIGVLMLTLAMNRPEATLGGLYYLIHSTLVTAALFLISDLVGSRRGQAGDRMVVARPMQQTALLGTLYAIAAISVIGMPPFSGFVGKVFVLQAATTVWEYWLVWPAVLVSGLATLVALSRAGSLIFWQSNGKPVDSASQIDPRWQILSVFLLLAASLTMVIWGAPLAAQLENAATAIHALEVGP